MPQAILPAKKGKATELSQAIAVKLAELRMRLQESQRQFADYMNVSFQRYQKYEKGQDRISFEKVVVLCHALKMSVDVLWPHNQQASGFAESEQMGYGEAASLFSKDEKQLIDLYRGLSKPEQKKLLATLKQQGTMTSD